MCAVSWRGAAVSTIAVRRESIGREYGATGGLLSSPTATRDAGCVYSLGYIYVEPNMGTDSTSTDLLLTVAEPTRLRILNCLAAAPLFVSDLQAILGLPQPTVSRHLQILRRAEVVRDTPIAQFVLYR